jgi:hypothetical protein
MADEEKAELESLRSEVALLRAVADAAARAFVDLTWHLSAAQEERERCEIGKGSYKNIAERHASLLTALHKVGYTETDKMSGSLVKPESHEETRLENATTF